MRPIRSIILVVDVDTKIERMLNLVLDKDNFEVEHCPSSKQALRLCASIKPDIVLINAGANDMNGAEFIAALRAWSHVPIVVISEHHADEDVVACLNIGADDYISMPFNIAVLQARIQAALRRAVIHEFGDSELSNGFLRIDLMRHQVFLQNDLIPFTPKEYRLLRYFVMHCGKMLGHREILKEVWGAAHSEDTQYLRVFIKQIREKIERDPAAPAIITTELGVGYRMEYLPDLLHHQREELQN